MKPIAILLLAACMAVPMLGCGRKKTFTDELPSNPTTGYDWLLDESADGLPESAGKVHVELAYVPNKAAENMAGVGGNTQITVTGVEPGEAHIRLCYVRAWEWDGDVATAAGVAVYTFTVGKDLSVKLGGAEMILPESMQDVSGK